MTDLVGRVLGNGKYRVERFLGSGGQGKVYRGTHLTLDVPIAIKVLTAIGEERDARVRFEREAKRAAQLKHSNIVGVYDFGLEGSIYYII